ncbi:hypothetical protein OCL06_00315 [Alteromonas sp. ASW11-19]|uniref:Uncharacterized protein n=1 Tax=Alteromonas salexigens TaxID=2982530 RepID=A0ABT2VKQ8_9ALTE|nr:hypothetical protein [Alteromonas salexigens]MCU7553033.1 hypothetical protein [Alteromonas salexigens]
MILRVFIAVFALLLLISATLLVVIVETTPLVTTRASEQVNDADTVNALLSQLQQSIKNRDESQTLVITEPQLDSLVGFIQRAAAGFRGKVNVTPSASMLAVSLQLPYTAGQGWLNLSVTLLPGKEVKVDQVSLGDLQIPGGLALRVLEWLVNVWTDSDIASYARQQVRGITMTDEDITVRLAPLEGLLRRLNEVKNGLTVEQDTELRDLTAYYLRYISWQDLSLDSTPQSLASYMQLTLARAAARSNPDTAVQHNKAAILALAVFVGHHRIANFVGDIQPDADRALRPARPAHLAGREDLARHFIISAALKVLSEQGVSLAIGEFKELMDRAMGGSGYSFVDLAADMAGVEFARVATDPDLARQVQAVIAANREEGVFMPAIEGLPEGLSKAEFEREYKQVDSDKYLQEVAEIRARLAELPLYATSP